MLRRAILILAMLVALTASAPPPSRPPLVLAASSLQESMSAAADAWARLGHARPVISFAASSALARQVEAGAPADLFASADEEWMDEIERRGLITAGTRADFVGNRLVLVAPRADTRGVMLGPRTPLVAMLGNGRLAMADPDSVPAGRYGKAALQRFGVWDRLAPRVVRAENVRAALALVERGAAQYAIVYATDARASTLVRVAGVFPPGSHPPIRYPLARLHASTSPDAEGFRRFLLSAPGKAIFARFGFLTP